VLSPAVLVPVFLSKVHSARLGNAVVFVGLSIPLCLIFVGVWLLPVGVAVPG